MQETIKKLPENKNSTNLDILRTISILLVIGAHLSYFLGYSGWEKFGKLGVGLFFLHTSYILMFSLERIYNSYNYNKIKTIISFYCKRLFRIYPLSIFIVLLVAIFTLPGHIYGKGIVVDSVISIKQIIANIFLVQNITQDMDIIGPLWTLPIEVQMYLFMPLLFFIGRKKNGIIYLIVIGFFAIIGQKYLESKGISIKFIKYIPFFLTGIISFFIYKSKYRKINGSLLYIIIIGAILLTTIKTFQGWKIIAIVGIMLPFLKEIKGKYIGIISYTIAKNSYALYLIHDTCIRIAFQKGQNLPVHIQYIFFIALLGSISFLLYEIIERPGINYGKKIETKINTLI